MNIIKNILTFILYSINNIFLFPLGRYRLSVLYSFIQKIIPTVGIQSPNTDNKVKFFCPNEITFWRAKTMFEKEPETIEWINTFDLSDTFWDIGANVGVYSLYAGSKGIKTLAFEPSSANYWILNQNIFLNNYSSVIQAFPIAFSKSKQLGFFNMSGLDIGGALYQFGAKENFIHLSGVENTVNFHQGMLGFSIDEFVSEFKPDLPNHIKIDVDSIEVEIIMGAQNLLKNKIVKSVLVELDSSEKDDVNLVTDILSKSGLRFHHKKHSVDHTPKNLLSLYNYIFIRE
jgi:FkbM family methyltransferase